MDPEEMNLCQMVMEFKKCRLRLITDRASKTGRRCNGSEIVSPSCIPVATIHRFLEMLACCEFIDKDLTTDAADISRTTQVG